MGKSWCEITAAWGKEGGTGRPHPAVCHLIDTAAVAEVLYPVLLGPRIRTELETSLGPLGDVRGWVSVLCGLHDLGKVSPVFQAQCAELAITRMGPKAKAAIDGAKAALRRKPRKDIEHGLITAAHLYQRLAKSGAAPETADAVACAVGGHHGWLPDKLSMKQTRSAVGHIGGSCWRRLRDAVMDKVTELWGLGDAGSAPWEEARLGQVGALGLAGLASVSDWIASSPKHFEWCPELTDTDLPAYREKAQEKARNVVARLGWSPWRPSTTEFTTLFGTAPRRLQAAVEELVANRDRPGVLVIEAPTGEGKTKAGLLAATHMVRTLSLSGVYAALPTRATGKAFYDETTEMLARSGSPVRAVPVHGLALQQIRAEDTNDNVSTDLSEVEPTDVATDHGDGQVREELTTAAREWFTKKRGLLSPIGVGTVDQALFSVVRSRHTFVRLVGLSNKVLLVDEVHAFDTYTSRLLDRLMWWCGRLGIPVILMSATLPASRRRELLTEWRAGARVQPITNDEPASADPDGWRLTWVDAHTPETVVPLKPDQNRRRVKLVRLTDDDVADWVLDQIGTRASAMVVHSTRPRVQRTAAAVRKAVRARGLSTTVISIVGGAEDARRAGKEAEIRALLGPNSEYPRNVIVIGTSLLENLDVDVDVMVSDMCPVDLLLQRLGRLHRYERADRAISELKLGLIGVRNSHNLKRITFPGPSSIYLKQPLLATWMTLPDAEPLVLPDDIPNLVHAVYETAPETQASANYRRSLDLADYRGHVPCIPRCTDDDALRELTADPGSPYRTRRETGAPEDRT